MTRFALVFAFATSTLAPQIGQEISVPHQLADGEEFTIPLLGLLAHGKLLSTPTGPSRKAAGRPTAKGTGPRFVTPSPGFHLAPGCNPSLGSTPPFDGRGLQAKSLLHPRRSRLSAASCCRLR
jgi:hypothetical protein